jgi:hypothetical protein
MAIGGLGVAHGQRVYFLGGETPPAPFVTTPANPTSCEGIRFQARTDGRTYGNGCYAAGGHGGSPRLVVDDAARTVRVQFVPPVPQFCTEEFAPVNGVGGLVGPLAAGDWTLVVGSYGQFSFQVQPRATNGTGLDFWHERNLGAPTNSLRSVVYGNGLFVAVGDGGTILTSADGSNWTARSSGTISALWDVTFGNGRFVAVGGIRPLFLDRVVATSMDGTNWTANRVDNQRPLRSVGYGNGLFIAGSDIGEIFGSRDGTNFALLATIPGNSVEDITYGNGLFVAAGLGGTTMASEDGTDWVVRDAGGAPNPFSGICFGNNTFVAVGGGGAILTSADGHRWSKGNSGTSVRLEGIAYGNGLFVAVGREGTIITSPDGMQWTRRCPSTICWLEGVVFGQDTFVAVGEGGAVLQSAPVVRVEIVWALPAPGFALMLRIWGPAGRNYLIETTGDRDLGRVWYPLFTVFSDVSPRTVLLVEPPFYPNAFYRVMLLP